MTFKTDAVSIRKALVNGEIEEALTYFESLAEDKEKAGRASGSVHTAWEEAADAFKAASRAARYMGQLQKAIDYAHKSLESSNKSSRSLPPVKGHR